MMSMDFTDIVSYQPSITIFGKHRYISTIGKLVGSISILIISISCFYLFFNFVIRSEFSLVYTHSSDYYSSINLSNTPLAITLGDAFSNPISENFQEIRINFWNYTKEEGKTSNSFKFQEIELAPCNAEKHLGEYQHLFKNIDLANFKCIPLNKYNLTLYGKYGDAKDNSFINISVNMCNNKTKNNTCVEKSVLEPHLKNIYLSMIHIDYEVDHFNFEKPLKAVLRTHTFPINWDLHARYFYSFNSLIYKTDDGRLIQQLRTEKTWKFCENDLSVQIRHGSALFPDVTIGTITIFQNPTVEKYIKIFPKLVILLAKIGGVIHGVLFMARAFCYFITKNLFLTDMINLNFNLNDESEEIQPKPIKIKNIRNNQSSSVHVLASKPNFINNSKEIKRKKNDKIKFQPSWCNLIFPTFLNEKNKKMKFIHETEKALKKFMSFDYIFKQLLQYERLKKILFSEQQFILLENLPKWNLDSLPARTSLDENELVLNVHHLQMNKQDKINSKILEYFC